MLCNARQWGIVIIVTVLIGAVLAVSAPGAAENNGPERFNGSADDVVEPGESIQDAINSASPGDTIEVQAGVYEEALLINKTIELVGTGDVILDGDTVATDDGITVDTNDVTIDGFEVARFDGDGISVLGDMLGSRTIEIANVTARLNGENNIDVLQSTDQDTVELENVVSKNNDGGDNVAGIYLASETVVAENIVSEGSEDAGLWVVSGSEGNVTVRNATITDSGDGDYNEREDGIYVASAQSVTLENVETNANEGDGINVAITDAIAGGRDVVLTNVTSRQNGENNIDIGGTADEDTVELQTIESKNNDGGTNIAGIYLESETVVAEDIVSEGSEDAGLWVVSGSEGNVTVRNATITDSGDGDFDEREDGLYVASAQSVTLENVEAVGNDGNGINVISTQSVIFENGETNENGDDGIKIAETDAVAGGRTAVLTNITSRQNGENNIDIQETPDEDTVELQAVKSKNNEGDDNVAGIYLESETVVAENIISDGTEATGLWVVSGSEGNVTVRNATITDSGDGDFDTREDGIYVASAQSVTFKNVVTNGNEYDGIHIAGTDAVAGGRDVALTNVTSRQNGENNVDIRETSDEDTVELQTIESKNNDGGDNTGGIYLKSETVVAENIISDGSEDVGLWVVSGSEGNVTVRNATITDSGDGDSDNRENGIYVASAQSVTLEDIEITGSGDDGLEIAGTDATGGGRTIEIRNVTSRLNTLLGGFVGGTSDEDTVVLTQSRFVENGDGGLSIGADSTNMSRSVVEGNDGAGLRFRSGIANSTVDSSSILDNSGPEIINEDESAYVDARGNWWGDPGGPAEDEIVGNVLVEDPLETPPGVAVSAGPETLEVKLGEQETVPVAVTSAGDGVAAYSFVLTVTDASVAEITDIVPTNDPEFVDIEISDDGSEAVVNVGMGDDVHETPNPTLVETTLAGVGEGEATLDIADVSIASPENEQYLVGAATGVDLTVAEQFGPPPVVDDPPNDLNGDGLFRDVDGDGSFDIFDVQALFSNLGSEAVQGYPDAFNFNGDENPDGVSIFDVQALFDDLADGILVTTNTGQ